MQVAFRRSQVFFRDRWQFMTVAGYSEHDIERWLGPERDKVARYHFKWTRFCVLCLRSGMTRVPASWEQPMAISCELHGILLNDVCSRCGSKIFGLRGPDTPCSCGNLLSSEAFVAREPWVATLMRLGGLSEAPLIPALCTTQSYNVAVAKAFRSIDNVLTLGNADQHGMQEIVRYKDWLVDWPVSFKSRIARYALVHHTKRMNLYLDIYRLNCPEIQTAISEVIQATRNDRPMVQSISPAYVAWKELLSWASTEGVDVRTLGRWVNKFQPAKISGPDNAEDPRTMKLVQLPLAVGQLMSRKDLAAEIGTSSKTLWRLTRVGAFDVCGLRIFVPVPSKPVREFAERLRVLATSFPTGASSFYPLFSLTNHEPRKKCEDRIRRQLRAIRDGSLRLVRRPGTDGTRLDDLGFVRSDVREGDQRKAIQPCKQARRKVARPARPM